MQSYRLGYVCKAVAADVRIVSTSTRSTAVLQNLNARYVLPQAGKLAARLRINWLEMNSRLQDGDIYSGQYQQYVRSN